MQTAQAWGFETMPASKPYIGRACAIRTFLVSTSVMDFPPQHRGPCNG